MYIYTYTYIYNTYIYICIYTHTYTLNNATRIIRSIFELLYEESGAVVIVIAKASTILVSQLELTVETYTSWLGSAAATMYRICDVLRLGVLLILSCGSFLDTASGLASRF